MHMLQSFSSEEIYSARMLRATVQLALLHSLAVAICVDAPHSTLLIHDYGMTEFCRISVLLQLYVPYLPFL